MTTADAAGATRGIRNGSAGRDPVGRAVRRVIVCDDEPGVRMLLRINLELEGCTVAEASDGDELIALLRLSDPLPDAVTLDALMPHINGWRTTEIIRADPRTRDLPVIMISASTHVEDRIRADEAGVDAFVSKPFEPHAVVDLVLGLAARGRG
jgi:CheY-like chemotaxis protein